MSQTPPSVPLTDAVFAALRRAALSHVRCVGRHLPFVSDLEQDALRYILLEAPYCLLAHDGGADPRFVLANRAALACFEYSWSELVGLPSRLSAEPDQRDERARLLQAVSERGFVEGYRGLRIAKSGRRFWIEDVTVWNVYDEQGAPAGQAACYASMRPDTP